MQNQQDRYPNKDNVSLNPSHTARLIEVTQSTTNRPRPLPIASGEADNRRMGLVQNAPVVQKTNTSTNNSSQVFQLISTSNISPVTGRKNTKPANSNEGNKKPEIKDVSQLISFWKHIEDLNVQAFGAL